MFFDTIRQVFLSLFPEYVEMIFSYSISDPIKYHVYGFGYPPPPLFHLRFYLPLYCLLPPVLAVASVPFLIGQSAWMSISGSFQIILPILFPWLMPCHFSLCCILHGLACFPGALLVLVCWILVPGKISTCSASCLWFWYVGCIQIYVENHSDFSAFYYCVWMCRAVV